MKNIIAILAFVLVMTGCKNESRENRDDERQSEVSEAAERVDRDRDSLMINIKPIEHATAVIDWDGVVFYTDPVGGAEAFEGEETPDFILITDIHGDHMDAKTLQAIGGNVEILAPQAVKDELPDDLARRITVLENGQKKTIDDFEIEAIPMYNLPEDDPDSRHTKGRGNGYIVEKDDKRLYISGDTEDIPEMRELEDINVALVCMNLPYTMSIEQAADAVLEFKPKKVYPYHYRGQDGLADVESFKKKVEEENDDIEVVLIEWYPQGVEKNF